MLPLPFGALAGGLPPSSWQLSSAQSHLPPLAFYFLEFNKFADLVCNLLNLSHATSNSPYTLSISPSFVVTSFRPGYSLQSLFSSLQSPFLVGTFAVQHLLMTSWKDTKSTKYQTERTFHCVYVMYYVYVRVYEMLRHLVEVVPSLEVIILIYRKSSLASESCSYIVSRMLILLLCLPLRPGPSCLLLLRPFCKSWCCFSHWCGTNMLAMWLYLNISGN